MSEIGEAVGTATEGGLFARVVGGRFGRGRARQPRTDDEPPIEGACLNCGTELVGPHCHECGQKVRLHRTIGAILHDLVHGVLHLDGKLWRTLPMLTLRPGRLTRRYIDGERAKFVSPMAMFLFSVFLMFAVFQALGFTAPTDFGSREQLQSNLKTTYESTQEERAELEKQIAALPETAEEREALESELAELAEDLEGLEAASAVIIGGDGVDSLDFKATGIEFLDRGIVAKWRENPGLMLYKLQANGYKFSWLLIPLSIPFVWLIFAWKRRFKAYDHAIFVTYSLAFMSLLFIALSLLGVLGVPTPLLLTAGSLIPPIHIYKQLRGTYGLRRFSALWRLAAMLVFINVVIVLFLQALLVLGAF